jgi:RNA polymerase sigma factor (TIGR02999 family)
MVDDARDHADITQLLIAGSGGRREALDDLMPIAYADLRRVAAGLRREAPGHALQPTALVHEAFVRLVDQKQVKWRSRAHFFGVAAGLMRRILVDTARRRRAEKRGVGWERVTLAGDEAAPDSHGDIDVLVLHEALERLAELDPQLERSGASVLRGPDDRGNGGSRWNLGGNRRA